MNFNKIRHVLAVGKYGSFTVAADRLGLTQSAITKNVAAVELDLGISIFHRTSAGIQMTEDGRHFIDRMSRLMLDADDLVAEVKSKKAKENEHLRVVISPAAIEAVPAPSISQWMKKQRGTLLELTSNKLEIAIKEIKSGSADLMMAGPRAIESYRDLKIRPLKTLKNDIFVRKDHPLTKLSNPTHADLMAYDSVAPDGMIEAIRLFHDMYERYGHDPHMKIHSVDYFPIVRRMVSHSDCFSFVMRSYSKTDNFKKYFTALPMFDMMKDTEICFAYDAKRPLKKSAKEFLRYFDLK